jgi:hypothetical protein
MLHKGVIILSQFNKNAGQCTICIGDMENMVLCLILRERIDPEQQGRRRTKREFAKR